MNETRWHRPPGGSNRPDGHQSLPRAEMTEGEYLQELARSSRPVVVHLRSGEAVRGVIEYFDQRFIRLTRQGDTNLFIFKKDIKYFFEE